ncbi:MAG: DUF4915 domain-containing protein [Bryobacteraceae bacterium]
MDLSLTLDNKPVHLVASCLGDGDTGGGLIYHDGKSWIGLDDVSTTGLFVSNDELVRMLWAPNQVASGTVILHYTPEGFERQVVIQGLTDPHDVLWDGENYAAVSSFQDAVVWASVNGDIVRRYQPAQGADCWHLNCLLLDEGVLYATAFGRFSEPRGWAGHQREGTGMLFRLDTGEDILTELCCPHTPRRQAENWIVCCSSTSELRAFNVGDRGTVKRVQLQDWVRGLAIADEFVLVGESVNRQLSEEVRGATVAVLDRKTWYPVERLKLPYREVYDLVLVSSELLEGLRRSPSPQIVASCPPQFIRHAPAAV